MCDNVPNSSGRVDIIRLIEKLKSISVNEPFAIWSSCCLSQSQTLYVINNLAPLKKNKLNKNDGCFFIRMLKKKKERSLTTWNLPKKWPLRFEILILFHVRNNKIHLSWKFFLLPRVAHACSFPIINYIHTCYRQILKYYKSMQILPFQLMAYLTRQHYTHCIILFYSIKRHRRH